MKTVWAHCRGGQAALRWGPRGHGGGGGVRRQGGLLMVVYGCRRARLQDRLSGGGRRHASAQAVALALLALVFDWRLEGYRRDEDAS